jgi:hypothetical protein
MTMTIFAILAAAAAATSGAAPASHTLSVQHSSGAVQAEYRGDIKIQQKQVGAVAPPGRPSSLRCVWSASMEVNRTATGAGGVLASRSFVESNVANGSRAGWCNASRDAIQQDVAKQVGDPAPFLAKAAEADRPALMADLDRLAATQSAS